MKRLILPLLLLVAGIVMTGLHFFKGNVENPLKLDIEATKVLMPAAYKVYANPNVLDGKYYLFKMMVTNQGNKPIDDIDISYRIPRYIDWNEIESVKRLNPGQSAVVSCYPVFNDDIVEKTTSSRETAEIRIISEGIEIEEKFAFDMKGRSEFVYTSIPSQEISSYPDMMDNRELLACFITPEDPIIKYYTQQIQEKLLKGDQASVSNNPDDAIRFLIGIYEATNRSHMVYSGTKGVPAGFGDVQSTVQNLRLPREVVTGNTGLCIELSLLYASVLANEGLSPIIYLIPGHAYPGFLLNGQYYAIEATAIGGEGIGGRSSAQEAVESGMKELNEFISAAQAGDPRYMILNVNDLISQGVLPMELKDDSFLRQKIDEIAKTFNRGTVTSQRKETYNTNPEMLWYSGDVSFNFPMGWQRFNMPNPQLPFLVSQINSPEGIASIEVYRLDGFNDVDSALRYLAQLFNNFGAVLQYQYSGQKSNGFSQYEGTTTSMNGTVRWTALLRAGNNRVSGISTGAATQYFQQYQTTFNNILSTLN